MNYKNLKDWIKDPSNKMTLILLMSLLVIILITSIFDRPHQIEEKLELRSADTYIPAGYVLVPVEIQNIESIIGLIGDFAVVDLFTTSLGRKQSKVGTKLKLLRAPLNPDLFAVLVPDEKVADLMNYEGPFWATIQNPNSNSKESISSKRKSKSKIEYYQGDSI